MFPGALERLIEKGLDAVEDADYAEAVEAFEQAYHFDPENTRFFAPYTLFLYMKRKTFLWQKKWRQNYYIAEQQTILTRWNCIWQLASNYRIMRKLK